MVKFIHSHFKNFPAILLHYIREWLVSLSTQAFSLHWLHHLCRLSQASSYPFYLIFILITSPILDIATAFTLTSCKVGCFVYITDIQVHGTKEKLHLIIYSGSAEAYNHRDYRCAFGQKSQDFMQVVRFLQIMVHFL